MTDIARLGYAVDSAELTAAVKQLEKLNVSNAKAEMSARQLSKTQSSASLAAARAADVQASAAFRAAAGNKDLSASERAATAEAAKQASASLAAARATDLQATAAMAAAKANLQQAKTAQEVVDAHQRMQQAANDNANVHKLTAGQMQSNFTNMAAQFQDIGVTAAMGMNPLMIGMQQGAQISGIFAGQAGGLRNVLKTVGTAFVSVLSPVSLFIIALTAGVSWLIQYAIGMDKAGDHAKGLGDKLTEVQFATSAVGNAQGILGGVMDITTGKINTQSTALIALARAQLAVAGIESKERQAKAAETIASTTAANAPRYNKALAANPFGQDNTLARLQDDLRAGKKTTLEVIKSLEGMVQMGQIGAQTFSDLAKAYANFGVEAENQKAYKDALDLIDGKKTGTSYLLKPSTAKTGKPAKSAAEEESDKFGKLMTGAGIDLGKLQQEAAGIGIVGKAAERASARYELMNKAKADNINLDIEGRQAKIDSIAAQIAEQKSMNDYLRFADEMNTSAEDIAYSAQQQIGALGLVGFAAKEYAYKIQLENDAHKKNIDLTIEGRQHTLDLAAAKMAASDQSVEQTSAYDKEATALAEQNAELMTQLETLGMSAEAAANYRYQKKLLNDERLKGIVYGEQKKAALIATAKENERLTASIKLQTQNMQFEREAYKGFFGDFYKGVMDGKSVWQSFGDAFNSVMDKIIDRLLNDLLDAIFQVNGAVGGGGGFLGGLGSLITGAAGLLGGGGAVAGIMSSANASLKSSSVGMANLAPAPSRFANGGAFTNGIVQQPTAFFAKGGAPGIMGEAGPEAIMPLQRGPDGSLGIQAHGKMQSSNDNGGTKVFDMRGAVVTEDLLAQMEIMASEHADVAVVRNNARQMRTRQRSFAK